MRKLYSAKMLKGHGIYPTGDSHEQRRHSRFSKSRAAPTALEIRLGLGMGSANCRGYSGTTFNIGSDSACLIALHRINPPIISLAANNMVWTENNCFLESSVYEPTPNTYKIIVARQAAPSATGNSSVAIILNLISFKTLTSATYRIPPFITCSELSQLLTFNACCIYMYPPIILDTNNSTRLIITRMNVRPGIFESSGRRRGLGRITTENFHNQFKFVIFYKDFPRFTRCPPRGSICSYVLDPPLINCSPSPKGAKIYIDKSPQYVNLLNKRDIQAFKLSTFSQSLRSMFRVSIRSQGRRRRRLYTGKTQLARTILRNKSNPPRYDSRTFTLNIFILIQTLDPATPSLTMDRVIAFPTDQLAIRHPSVTLRQLLPRDCALINPEIKEMDTSSRPPLVSFLVLSRATTSSEEEAGELSLPICHAEWDFPNPDTFYDVLQQVVDLLEPADRKPGVLITAASASDTMGICIIQIRNKFGHSMDFIRRAFRGAAQPGIHLETFPLDAFLPPFEIHKSISQTIGMKRYLTTEYFSTNHKLYPSHPQAAIYGQHERCHVQPTGTAPNDRPRGTVAIGSVTAQKGCSPKVNQAVQSNFLKFYPDVKINCMLITICCYSLSLALRRKRYTTNKRQRKRPLPTELPCLGVPNRALPMFRKPTQRHRLALPRQSIQSPTLTTTARRQRPSGTSPPNISNKEKGMPTPPRVERPARTINQIKKVIKPSACTYTGDPQRKLTIYRARTSAEILLANQTGFKNPRDLPQAPITDKRGNLRPVIETCITDNKDKVSKPGYNLSNYE